MALAIKVLVLACALFVVTMADESGSDQQSGGSRISESQLSQALRDNRYMKMQLKCVNGEGPCDPVGRRLKSLVPLILKGSCPQCSDLETRQIKRVLYHIQRSYPKEWNKIVQQYAGAS